MTDDSARAILARLQAAVDSHDLEVLEELFDERSVLIGTSGDGRTPEGLRNYLEGVAAGPPFRWDWREVVAFHETEGELGFAAFGEISFVEDGVARHEPIRLTLFAVAAGDRWVIRQFHGSIPFTGA